MRLKLRGGPIGPVCSDCTFYSKQLCVLAIVHHPLLLFTASHFVLMQLFF